MLFYSLLINPILLSQTSSSCTSNPPAPHSSPTMSPSSTNDSIILNINNNRQAQRSTFNTDIDMRFPPGQDAYIYTSSYMGQGNYAKASCWGLVNLNIEVACRLRRVLKILGGSLRLPSLICTSSRPSPSEPAWLFEADFFRLLKVLMASDTFFGWALSRLKRSRFFQVQMWASIFIRT